MENLAQNLNNPLFTETIRMVQRVKARDQQTYLEDGTYDNFLKNITPDYLYYLYREEIFFENEIKRGSKVLDIGCGEGRLTRKIASWVGLNGAVIGLDFSRIMIEKAIDLCQVFKNINFAEMDARDIYKLNEEFDYILLPFDFLGLLPESDQVPILVKVSEKLRQGGLILATVFSENAHEHQLEQYKKIGFSGIYHDEKYVYAKSHNYAAQRFSKEQLKEIFNKANLETEIERLTDMSYGITAGKK